jgi:NAD(P)-dependent dehydrogenase (short-subunit alcohol dehydrogenase family)
LDERANLSGKVALVAGGGGGLGRAIALDLARAGVHLWLCDVDAALLGETENWARDEGSGSKAPASTPATLSSSAPSSAA